MGRGLARAVQGRARATPTDCSAKGAIPACALSANADHHPVPTSSSDTPHPNPPHRGEGRARLLTTLQIRIGLLPPLSQRGGGVRHPALTSNPDKLIPPPPTL